MDARLNCVSVEESLVRENREVKRYGGYLACGGIEQGIMLLLYWEQELAKGKIIINTMAEISTDSAK